MITCHIKLKICYHLQHCSYLKPPPVFLWALPCQLLKLVTISNYKTKIIKNENTLQLAVPCNLMVLSFKSQIKKHSTLQHKTKIVVIRQSPHNFTTSACKTPDRTSNEWTALADFQKSQEWFSTGKTVAQNL